MLIPLNDVIYFDFITSSPSTGAATDADSTPTFAIYENSTDTDIGSGGNATKRTSLTGNYRLTFTCSAANGFELDKWYNVIASATVGGIAGKAVVKTFRIVAAENTAGYPIADAMKINGTTQTAGDIYARLGAPAGASVSADVAAIQTSATAIKAKTDSLTFTSAGYVDSNVYKVGGTAQTAGDLYALSALIATYIDTEVAAIKAKTDNLPAAPAAVSDIPTAATVAAAVMASVIETGYDLTKSCKLMLSALAGKLSGAATTSVSIRDVTDSKTRISATVDSDGNRTAFTYDLS